MTRMRPWDQPQPMPPQRDRSGGAWGAWIGRHGLPLRAEDDLRPLFRDIGSARYVLIGEASHGTAEFYLWRAAITARLIRDYGFSFVAVEGDWPDCYRINRYVRGMDGGGHGARQVLHAFERWPTWMWANRETLRFLDWLRGWNEDRPFEQRAGFYGLDVYSLWDSLAAVMGYLERHDGAALQAARTASSCFEPYGESIESYAESTALVPAGCEQEVITLLTRMREERPALAGDDPEAYFDAEQNALVTRNAELYYRAMVRRGSSSWNIRDHHMVSTLERLMHHYGDHHRNGSAPKAVVWAHNTHVGDARATDMAPAGMVNVGQLVRERHHEDGVYIIGFSSHRGTVVAADEWGAPAERMRVPKARPGSFDDLLHRSFGGDGMLLLEGAADDDLLLQPHGHRAIGVVYHPDFEAYGNYAVTSLPLRYDALLHIDHTHALRPLHTTPHDDVHDLPETYPFGL